MGTESNETVAAPSKGRVVGATVAGAAVTVVIGMIGSIVAGKAANLVTQKINPPVNTTNTTNAE